MDYGYRRYKVWYGKIQQQGSKSSFVDPIGVSSFHRPAKWPKSLRHLARARFDIGRLGAHAYRCLMTICLRFVGVGKLVQGPGLPYCAILYHFALGLDWPITASPNALFKRQGHTRAHIKVNCNNWVVGAYPPLLISWFSDSCNLRGAMVVLFGGILLLRVGSQKSGPICV